MIEVIKRRFALSTKGAKDFCKGVFFTTLLDIVLMLPVVFVFLFLEEYLRPVFQPSVSVTHGILYYSILGIIFMIVMYIFAVLQYRSTYTTVYDESANRRISLAEKLRKLPLAFFGEKNLSDLTATIMDDCTDLEHTFSHAVPQLFASIISILLITVGMAFYNWQLTIALFWVVPLAAAILLFSKKEIQKSNESNYLNKRMVTEHIQEGLDTIQEIKPYNQERDYLEKLDASIDTYEKVLTRNELVLGILVNGSQSVLKLGLASVIIVGANLLASGTIDLFTYLIFMVIGSRVYAPLSEVMNNIAALFYLDVRISRMNEMEALPVQHGTTDFTPKGYDIEFQQVDFAYEQGKQILKNLSFTARQGEKTALVGPSGSGKSTAARLAARFWDIQSGKITLGGQDISRIDPETLLTNYSVVFQEVVLFNASIMDNIRIGKRDATDEEVRRVARLAQCDEFVTKMPQGYQTIIGENGETLSGGERQRISIARALLKDAPIVLLDEATASLDVENETKIQAGISELVRNKTVLIIAHRMRTVANADKIVVLENGSVAEMGTPEELKKKNGIFARMVNRQVTNMNG
ncbi:ABC transporter, ATP-binding protein [Bacteroides xylanisolvens SD CC 2a]|uniref:ABC transporter, ATP-binding protein, putative n=1 Tax=Bacteroides xylanisolvens SD CC 1b TaxID=702447 RepID=D4VRJ6_9BACE|nr:ABC transporter ATP-binding protein [Bacteroides xylanisolvens]EFF59786.1 ABC transporter, ATP-binding protein [Bacteroides xylanisolvens SD CC 2a]EFG11476.1 ABC transporter, ATP-binding protein [Bacteroides xylanisolvens SD CC 1b]CDL99219.1 ABC transporter, ATP-binding protein, putative [Bacteroides xylanisolvens SD CC 2a]CDM02672.1 ABC transporter, ATP-binding protein, putative [Bacteroides xylanisolvens SD CC 1b]